MQIASAYESGFMHVISHVIVRAEQGQFDHYHDHIRVRLHHSRVLSFSL